MEDFLIRDGAKICLFSQESKNYVMTDSFDKIISRSAHPFLISDYETKKKVAFHIQIVHTGNLYPFI